MSLAGEGSNPIIVGVLDHGYGQLGPSGTSPNGFPEADKVIDESAREEFEAITDPDGPAYSGGTGWFGGGNFTMGPEIADQCQDPPSGYGSEWGSVAQDGSNHVWNGNKYIIQICGTTAK